MIYVLCPAGVKTGGTELLHQLVFQINNLSSKQKAQLVYTGTGNIYPVKSFEKYVNENWIKEADVIENKENIIVIPETSLSEFNKFKLGKKYIWWLSVDNFYRTGFNGWKNINGTVRQLGVYHTVGSLLKGRVQNYKKEINSADLHLFQSYYASHFLKNTGILNSKKVYLSDYINDLYIDKSAGALKHSRENIVLYNPKKGLNFTKKIIDKSPSWIKWVPLINMSNDEVYQNLISGKVYIDFGNHPGKDRFPREAAISGCCILTDRKGAAAYHKDVPILEKYKFEDSEKNISKIMNQIEYCLTDYQDAIKDFDNYREFIKKEKEIFKKDVIKIFR